MSSTMESKSASDTREHPHNSRVSSFEVRPSVAGMIADSDGNLDEKKAVAALSQTREQNKHMWIGCFVLIGVVFILIAANIGTSVAVARLTRQLNVDPVTGMATIPGSEDVVMKTSTARYKEEDITFHTIPTEVLSSVEKVEFADGDLSFDVKGYARMSNETVLLVEGGSLTFDIIGLKNITGDVPRQMMFSLAANINNDNESLLTNDENTLNNSSAVDGNNADESLLTNDENTLNNSSTVDENDETGSSTEEGVRRLSRRPRRTPRGSEDLQPVDSIDMASNNPTRRLCDWKQNPNCAMPQHLQDFFARSAATAAAIILAEARRCGHSQGRKACFEHRPYCNTVTGWCGSSQSYTPYENLYNYCFPMSTSTRCGPGYGSCPSNHLYCNEDSGWCGSESAHQNAQPGTKYDFCDCWHKRDRSMCDTINHGGEENHAQTMANYNDMINEDEYWIGLTEGPFTGFDDYDYV